MRTNSILNSNFLILNNVNNQKTHNINNKIFPKTELKNFHDGKYEGQIINN